MVVVWGATRDVCYGMHNISSFDAVNIAACHWSHDSAQHRVALRDMPRMQLISNA